MAAYTTPDAAELGALAQRLGLGTPGALVPVAAGVENSTWFLTCSGQREEWVLTIVERGDAEDLRFPTALCAALHRAGLPVPLPRADAQGTHIHRLAGKPALLAPRAPGHHLQRPQPEHCAAIGDFLARMHLLDGLPGELSRANPFGRDWLESTAAALAPDFAAVDRALLARQLDRYRRLAAADALPRGPIHADLFRDNALFVGDRLSAVIDFNSACVDWLLLDVAIALHDWAATADRGFDPLCAAALLAAYARQRPFAETETAAWRDLLCLAATRFWVSREAAARAPTTELTGRGHKDPEVFRARLRQCLDGALPPLPG